MNEQMQQVISGRIRWARETANLTQEALSGLVGFKDRQILSNIESGRRDVSAEELVQFSEALSRPLDFFTDAFILTGEAAFSWRAKDADPELLDQFEEKAGRWLALYRRLGSLQGYKGNPILPKLALNQRSSFEDAAAQGEALAEAWGAVGEPMAPRLHETAQDRLNILVMMVDAPSAISGAACQLPEFYSVLINRKDPPGRRHFDFAHELFHLLTWDTLPPRREDFEDWSSGYNDKRIERMAENFAGGLLMPRSILEPLWKRHEGTEIHQRLLTIAAELGVTAQAVRYRAVNLGWIGAPKKGELDDHRLIGLREAECARPLPFSKPFVERLHWGLSEGRISARRAAQLLDMTVQELGSLIQDYGMDVPFDI